MNHTKEFDWNKLRDEFFSDLTRRREAGITGDITITDFNTMPHNVFEWFKRKLSTYQKDRSYSKEDIIRLLKRQRWECERAANFDSNDSLSHRILNAKEPDFRNLS